jgi:8-oxo-dGTP pyrophosphatase MutT (NUDIX family)
MENRKNKKFSIYYQSAAIPFQYEKNEVQVLLVTSRRGRRWVIPKGIIEEDLTPAKSALKEAYEEAGIHGEVFSSPFGDYQYHKWGGVCHVQVFGLKVTKMLKHWPEEDFRKRAWFSIASAIQVIEELELQQIIKKLPESISASEHPKFWGRMLSNFSCNLHRL